MRALFATIALFFVTGPANALTHVGTFYGNDPFPNSLLGSQALAKCQVSNSSCSWEDGPTLGDYTDAFSVVFTTSKTGTWSWTPSGDETLLPTHLVVKASKYHAVYGLEGALSGSFNSFDIFDKKHKNPEISHVSFYGRGASTPEPAAWSLMIAGFAALGLARRRWLKRASLAAGGR